jgi:putative SOS response-associated peptidase YedK
MCGRYSFAPELKVVNEHYKINVDEGKIRANYNCAPSQSLPVISNDKPAELSFYHWGLIPFWAKDKRIGYKMINARGETLREKPSYRNAYKQRRCLIPADAFYEWKKPAGSKAKIPYRIFVREQGIFSMAGLWEEWKDEQKQPIRSFTIVTVEPNAMMAEIHNRMPLILEKADEQAWLTSDNMEQIQSLIKPFPAGRMDAYPISSLVNSPANNSPEIAEPV